MPFRSNINDRELDKFFEDFKGETTVNVGDTFGLMNNPKGLVSMGLVPGIERAEFIGFNRDVDTNNLTDIITSDELYPFPLVASTVDVQSDDANDTLLGSGARRIKINGLDASYNPITEDIEMDGTTSVTSLNSYLRVNETIVLEVGANTSNEGEITTVPTGGSDLLSEITLHNSGDGFNRSMFAIYTVPLGKTAILYDFIASIGGRAGSLGNKESQIMVRTSLEGSPFLPSVLLQGKSQGTSIFPFHATAPRALPEKTDIVVTALGLNGNVSVTALGTLFLYDNATFGISL